MVAGRELDSVNILCSQILRRCFPKNKLPIPCPSSPLSFSILDLDSASTHTASKEGETADDSGEGESSEVESEEETNGSAKDEKEDMTSQSVSLHDLPTTVKTQKPRDDLHMYDQFFPEQYEYQVHIPLHLTQTPSDF